MEIEPLCPELIAKLEIAVAHRNLERAVAVVESHFEGLNAPEVIALEKPLSDILPVRQASLLAREGYFKVADLKGVNLEELKSLKGIGVKFIKNLTVQLQNLFETE